MYLPVYIYESACFALYLWYTILNPALLRYYFRIGFTKYPLQAIIYQVCDKILVVLSFDSVINFRVYRQSMRTKPRAV